MWFIWSEIESCTTILAENLHTMHAETQMLMADISASQGFGPYVHWKVD